MMDQVALSRFIGAETGGVGASWNSGLRTSKIRGTVKEDQNDVTMYSYMHMFCLPLIGLILNVNLILMKFSFRRAFTARKICD